MRIVSGLVLFVSVCDVFQQGRTQEPQPVKPIYVPSDTMAARSINKPSPIYPEQAVAKQIDGVVVLSVLIDAQGAVTSANVLRGPEELRGAAQDAVRKWTFRPWEQDGKSVPVETTVPVSFTTKHIARTPPRLITRPIGLISDLQHQHVGGTISLAITVEKEGHVKEVIPTANSTLPAGLQYQVIAAIKKWEYQPATEDGVPVEGKTSFQFYIRREVAPLKQYTAAP